MSRPPIPVAAGSPVDALELHLRQATWTDTSAADTVWERFGDTYGWNRNLGTGAARSFREGDRRVMTEGRTVYVTPEIIDAVESAAESMPCSPLLEDRFPAPAGLIVFGRGLAYDAPSTEGWWEEFPIRAVGWAEADITHPATGDRNRGVMLFVYSETATVAYAFGNDGWPFESTPPPLFPVDVTGWGFGVPWADVDLDVYKNAETSDEWDDGHVKAPHVARMRRFLLALWTFMADEIVDVDRAPRLPRPVERRAARSGRTDVGLVTFVHLRRRARQRTDGERAVEWSHSWIVSGHWRKLRNRDTGEFEGRVTWVRPHVKGDGPLVVKERVVTVDR